MKGVDDRLRRLALRVRLAKGMRGMAIGTLIGTIVAIALATFDLFGVFYTDWPVLFACWLGGAILGFTLGFSLRVNRLDLADSIDRRMGFKNRLRSALDAHGNGKFDGALLVDAESRLAETKGREIFPLRFSKWHAGAAFGMAIAATLFLLGNSPVFLSGEAKQERAELQQGADQVRRVAKPILDPKSNPGEQERELAERLENLANDMERGRMTKKEALIRANELTEAAEKLAKERFASANKMTLEAQTLLERMAQERLAKVGFSEQDIANVEQTTDQLNKEEEAVQAEIDRLEQKLEKSGLSESQRNELEAELAKAKKRQYDIKLSKEVLAFLDRLHSMPEFKELQEMAKKLQKSADAAVKEGKQPTQEEIDAMIEKLEELARKLKDEESLREYIEKLKKALAECKGGACIGAGLPNLLGLLGGGSAGQNNLFADTDKVNKNTDEEDIEAKTESHGVRGSRSEQGTETHVEISGPASPGERSKTPYIDVLPKYEKRVERAIDRQKIPKSQQKRVREYFESLSGEKRK